MRVDANVSVRPVGTDAFGTRCEIKNLNSLRSLGRAIEYEAARQIALLESGGSVAQETRHWDESAGRTESMRSKEEANDYRYFPEPDLVPLAPDDGVAGAGPGRPGPHARGPPGRPGVRARWGAERGRDRPDPRRRRPGARRPGDGGRRRPGADRRWPWPGPPTRWRPRVRRPPELDAESFASVLAMESGGQLSATQSKAVLGALLERGGGDPAALAKEMGFEALGSDTLGRGARRGHRSPPRRMGALRRGRRQVDGGSSPVRS